MIKKLSLLHAHGKNDAHVTFRQCTQLRHSSLAFTGFKQALRRWHITSSVVAKCPWKTIYVQNLAAHLNCSSQHRRKCFFFFSCAVCGIFFIILFICLMLIKHEKSPTFGYCFNNPSITFPHQNTKLWLLLVFRCQIFIQYLIQVNFFLPKGKICQIILFLFASLWHKMECIFNHLIAFIKTIILNQHSWLELEASLWRECKGPNLNALMSCSS